MRVPVPAEATRATAVGPGAARVGVAGAAAPVGPQAGVDGVRPGARPVGTPPQGVTPPPVEVRIAAEAVAKTGAARTPGPLGGPANVPGRPPHEVATAEILVRVTATEAVATEVRLAPLAVTVAGAA